MKSSLEKLLLASAASIMLSISVCAQKLIPLYACSLDTVVMTVVPSLKYQQNVVSNLPEYSHIRFVARERL